MLKLISLEKRKHRYGTFVKASIIMSIVILVLLYFLAFVSQTDADPDMQRFLDYNSLVGLASALNLTLFCIMSSVMASRFIIQAYSGNQVNILFSYPVSRTRMMVAKLLCVYGFTLVSLVVCNILVLLIFGTTQSFLNFVTFSFTAKTVILILQNTGIIAVISVMLGMISVGFGFTSKSVPTTILSSVLFSTLFCNIIFNFGSDEKKNMLIFGFMLTVSIIGIIMTMKLINDVNKMEV